MWIGWLLGLFLLTTPALADPGSDERYGHDSIGYGVQGHDDLVNAAGASKMS